MKKYADRLALSGLLIFILIGLGGCVGCGSEESAIVLESAATAGLEHLPGTIGVTLKKWTSDGKEFTPQYQRFSIRRGVIARTGDVPAPAEEIRSGINFDAQAEGLGSDYIGGYHFGVYSYFANSPSGRYAAFSATPNGTNWDNASLILFDRETRAAVSLADSNGKWTIRSLAWSPDGRYIAYTRVESRTESCGFTGGLRLFTGHPIQTSSIFLNIVDLKGNLVGSVEVTSRTDWNGGIVWMYDSVGGG